MDKITPAFQKSLFDPTLSESIGDIADLGIDSFLDNEVLNHIPIVKILIGLSKTAQNIQDRNLLKQSVKFINTLIIKQ